MQVSDFVPTLQPIAEQVGTNLRYVCFFVLTSSIIIRTARAGRGDLPTLVRPIVTATILCSLIATLPTWFNMTRDAFWNIAVSIRSEFASSISPTGTALVQLIKPPSGGINWLDIGDSIAKAVQFAIGWLVVCIGGMVQLPMMIVQFVMECLCYMFLPIAISLFSLDSTKGLAVRYVQQTLAILAWPIGFAVVDLVGYSILTGPVSLGSALALAYGAATTFTPATLLMGCLVALWLILGSIATPLVMQMLFCSGVPLSSSVGKAAEMGMAAAGLARFFGGKGGGTTPSSGSTPPPSGPSGSGGAPPMTFVSGSSWAGMPTQIGPMQNAALMSLSSDPGGDRFASEVKQLSQIPKAIPY